MEKFDPAGKRIEQLGYNKNHVQIESLDALNHKTTFAFDKNNRLLKTTDPLGFIHSQTYDYLVNILTKIDGRGNVTKLFSVI